MSSLEGAGDLLLLGTSHRVAPPEVRDRLSLAPEESQGALRRLATAGAVREAMLLVTCNRTEACCLVSDPAAAERAVRAEVVRLRGEDLLRPGPHRYALFGSDAVQHVLRVAAGLDSLVVGEMQILGQVKDAGEHARAAGTCGPVLDRLLAAALHAGKRARAETAIGTGTVSMASAAVVLAAKACGGLAGRRVLVIGAGDTGRRVALHLAEAQPGRLLVANRTLERAHRLAAEVGGEAHPLAGLEGALAASDVAVSATASPTPLLSRRLVSRAMAARWQRPLVLVDIAVPRNVEPEVGALENVFLHGIEALQVVVEEGRTRREREAARVEAIVAEEAERFLAWLRGLGATPVLRELREHFERVRVEEVGKALRQFPAGEQERVERLTRSLVNKLLHLPTTRLRALDPGSRDGQVRLRALQELFTPADAGVGGGGRHGA